MPRIIENVFLKLVLKYNRYKSIIVLKLISIDFYSVYRWNAIISHNFFSDCSKLLSKCEKNIYNLKDY